LLELFLKNQNYSAPHLLDTKLAISLFFRTNFIAHPPHLESSAQAVFNPSASGSDPELLHE
jgi:hypothetical protein